MLAKTRHLASHRGHKDADDNADDGDEENEHFNNDNINNNLFDNDNDDMLDKKPASHLGGFHQVVKSALDESLTPLQKEVKGLTKEVRGLESKQPAAVGEELKKALSLTTSLGQKVEALTEEIRDLKTKQADDMKAYGTKNSSVVVVVEPAVGGGNSGSKTSGAVKVHDKPETVSPFMRRWQERRQERASKRRKSR